MKAAGSEDRHYLELVFANYAAAVGECCVEPVSLLPPPLPPLEQLFKTQLCQTFSVSDRLVVMVTMYASPVPLHRAMGTAIVAIVGGVTMY